MKRDFLRLSDCSKSELYGILTRAAELKARRAAGKRDDSLAGKILLCIFEKASTRTRLSFEAAMAQLGGRTITLSAQDSQLGRGEPIADTARVASRYVDGIMYRTFGDERLEELARHSSVPVINGLSEGGHPVQLLADLLTIQERFGKKLEGRKVAFIGDCASNMALSFVEASGLFGFELRLAAPAEFLPPAERVRPAAARVRMTSLPKEAAAGADVVVTDVWTSMGQEAESARRLKAFAGFCVDDALLSSASKKAIVLHCLPAHRGEEITAEVLEGPQSAAWDEAENRLHAQKALLEFLLKKRRKRR